MISNPLSAAPRSARRGPTKRRALCLATGIAAAFVSPFALATIGPQQTPLRVTQMYLIHGNGALYVSFQSGAMPGCYGNSGGYLYLSNSAFKELYAQLLTMVATGGIRASVVFTFNGSTGNWGDCTIDGLYLQP
jgi:hypothetical protein